MSNSSGTPSTPSARSKQNPGKEKGGKPLQQPVRLDSDSVDSDSLDWDSPDRDSLDLVSLDLVSLDLDSRDWDSLNPDCLHSGTTKEVCLTDQKVVSLSGFAKPNAARPNAARPNAAKSNADVLDLACRSAESTTTKSFGLEPVCLELDENAENRGVSGATLLAFDRDCSYYASLEIDDLADIQMQFTQASIERVIIDVGTLLRKEFGHTRVRRHQRRFSVLHNDFEHLVAGILRVQFYANRVQLPEHNIFAELTEQNGVTLSWGVGHDERQAIQERDKKKRQKQQRQQLRRKRRQSHASD